MSQALVLSGGGAKGAYQAGCIKAMQDLNIHFDIVTGTSIGALNGLLVCQGDYQKLYHLWQTLTLDQVLSHPVQFDFSIESLLQSKNMVKPFFKSYVDQKGADITPLKNLIHHLYDGKKAKASSMRYGLVTVQFPQLKAMEITIDQMNEDNIVEYAIASASCFPAFPIHKIDGQGYIDGGYFDNLPISLAMEMSATSIIAIELNQEQTHPYLYHRPSIVYIRPSHHLGGFLDFDRDLLDWRIRLGYLDTMKTFHKYIGYRYAFYPEDLDEKITQHFYQLILNYENQLNHHKLTNNDATPLTSLLKKDTYLESLQFQDYFLSGLEIVMEKHDYPYDKVYSISQVIKDIKDYYTPLIDQNEYHRFHLLNQVTHVIKDLSTNQIINYFYNAIDYPLNHSFIPITLFYKEYLIALFLKSLSLTEK